MGKFGATLVAITACGTANANQDPSSMNLEELREHCNLPKTDTQKLEWEPGCNSPGRVGCNFGGENKECRVCGDKNDVPCKAVRDADLQDMPEDPAEWTTLEPKVRARKLASKCQTPIGTVTWDPNCQIGKTHCYWGGVYEQCRLCEKDCEVQSRTPTTSRKPTTTLRQTSTEVQSSTEGPADMPVEPADMSMRQLRQYCGDVNPEYKIEWNTECSDRSLVGCKAGGKYHPCKYCGTEKHGSCEVAAPMKEVPAPMKEEEAYESSERPDEKFVDVHHVYDGELGSAWARSRREVKEPKASDLTKDPSSMTDEELRELCKLPKTDINRVEWEPKCKTVSRVGCNYFGEHQECRLCGDHRGVPCKADRDDDLKEMPENPKEWTLEQLASKCQTRIGTATWDPNCQIGIKHCYFGAVHPECRQVEAPALP